MEYGPARSSTAGIPMGRQGTYEDIGGSALFLASDLSTYITGTTLHPDGGAWASAGWWNWPEHGWVNNPPLTGLGLSTDDDCSGAGAPTWPT